MQNLPCRDLDDGFTADCRGRILDLVFKARRNQGLDQLTKPTPFCCGVIDDLPHNKTFPEHD